MGLGTILLILLIVLLMGGLVPWGGPAVPGGPTPFYHGYGYGWSAGGILGLVLVVVLILALLGHL